MASLAAQSGGGRARRRRLVFDRAVIDEAKARYNVSDIAARFTTMPIRRAGHEFLTHCLFHQERTPSMRLNDAKGEYHCFGCGEGGDPIRLVQKFLRVSFSEALRWLGAAELPPVDEELRARQLEGQHQQRIDDIRYARSIFADADPLEAGTHGAHYLEARGVRLPVPPTLRVACVPSYRNPETRIWGRSRPCIVGGCQAPDGTFVGIQRIYYRDDDPALGKADCKLSLGTVKGAALRLGPVRPHIHVCEGPEDSLSVRQECGDDRSIWAALGTSLMPHIGFPPEVTEATILGQNNAPGRAAVAKASDAYLERGLAVNEAYPPDIYDDWNDMLMDRRK